MSYCRIGDDSDVYVIKTYDQRNPEMPWACYGGWKQHLHPMITISLGSLSELKSHLEEHVGAGDKVPQRTFDRIEREMQW